MITASEVADMIGKDEVLIDKFIEEKLIPVLMETGNHKTTVTEKRVEDFFSKQGTYFGRNKILNEFTKRGFVVDFYCEDRPCGDCFYTIAVPLN